MSLSGLDSGDVEAAEKRLTTERGGWFLLSYTSRDCVQVLAQGAKGIVEMRDAVENYYSGTRTTSSPPGPLFGMIDFRRRKILIKLVLEGTSRLVQARVQVHWNSVTSRFPIHDTVFESTSTEQLNEAGFLAHIELHSGRSSAGSVSKKVPLDGISEETGEEGPADQRTASTSASNKPKEIDSPVQLVPADPISHPHRISSLVTSAAATSAALQESLAESAQASAIPEVSVTSEASLEHAGTSDTNDGDGTTRYSIHLNPTDSNLDASGRRFSTQSARPSTADQYSSSLYDYDMLYKPKVKLGPRPSMDRRPPSSKGQGVATLPAGLRSVRTGLSSTRPNSRDSTMRPKSRDSSMSTYKVPPPPPIPETQEYSFTPRRPSSSGNSVKSLPATLPKSPGMTREKQRLMKFREMYREKENQKDKGKATMGQTRAQKAKAANDDDEFASNADKDLEESEQVGLAAPQHIGARSSNVMSRPDAGSTLRARDANQDISSKSLDDYPRTSGESLSASSVTGVASSPISTVDSSARAASTRPTSVSESSDQEKGSLPVKHTSSESSVPSEDSSGGVAEVNAARAIVDEDVGKGEDETTTSETTPTGKEVASGMSGTNNLPLPSSKRHSKRLSTSDRRQMRRAMVSPISVPTAVLSDVSDAHLSDALSDSDADASYDEDFMDELHDAEVVEAKSIFVSKSPITPFFSRRPSAQLLDTTSNRAYSPSPSPSIMQLDHTPTGSPLRGAGKSPSRDLLGASESSTSGIAPTSVPREPSEKSISPVEDNSPVNTIGKDHEEESNGKREEEQMTNSQSSLPPKISASTSSAMLTSADRTPSFSLLTPTYPNRSSSGTFLSSVPQQKEEAIVVAKKTRLGSGVASKIADLQRSFSRGSSPGDAPPLPVLPATRSFSNSRKPLISQRASSLNDPAKSRSSTPPKSSSSKFQPTFPSRDLGGSVRGRSLSKGSLMSFDSRETKTSTPTRNHSSGSIGKLDTRRLSIYDSPPMPQVEFNDKRDTIQVKATIIRTDGPYAESKAQQFMESPLVISHQRAASPESIQSSLPPPTALPQRPTRSPSPTKLTKEKKHKRQRSSFSAALNPLRGFRSSSTVELSDTLSSPAVNERENTNRQSMDLGGSWRTLTRRASIQLSRSPSATRSPTSGTAPAPFSRSPSARGGDRQSMISPPPATNGEHGMSLTRSMSSSSLDSVTTTDSQQNPNGAEIKRKGSRTSRLMKRMSNGMSSIAAVTRLQLGTLNEVESAKKDKHETLLESDENHRGVGWKAVEVGDLNVQFPDTLLWKHRHITIDADGFLVLRPFQQNNSNPAAATIADRKLERRYHVSQFYPPFAPDMERMEMPFSVVLDFREDAEGVGGCLQVAAQSGKGQGMVLNVLTEAHRVWTS